MIIKNNNYYEDDIKLDEIILKKGNIIKYNGFPFYVKDDICMLGRKENYDLAIEEKIKKNIQNLNNPKLHNIFGYENLDEFLDDHPIE
jgi:hypothetical protein